MIVHLPAPITFATLGKDDLYTHGHNSYRKASFNSANKLGNIGKRYVFPYQRTGECRSANTTNIAPNIHTSPYTHTHQTQIYIEPSIDRSINHSIQHSSPTVTHNNTSTTHNNTLITTHMKDWESSASRSGRV
jgi:hypothetical protein